MALPARTFPGVDRVPPSYSDSSLCRGVRCPNAVHRPRVLVHTTAPLARTSPDQHRGLPNRLGPLLCRDVQFPGTAHGSRVLVSEAVPPLNTVLVLADRYLPYRADA